MGTQNIYRMLAALDEAQASLTLYSLTQHLSFNSLATKGSDNSFLLH